MAICSSERVVRYTARTLALALSTLAVTGAGAAVGGMAPAAAGGAVAHAAPSPADSPSDLLLKGDSGPEVEELQEQLRSLGYWVGPVDGEYGELTVQAVYALQKTAGIARDGVVGPDTRAALDDGTAPEATASGDVVEVDLDRQLLLVVSDGEVERVFNTSTGSGEMYESQGELRRAVTPTGEYTVFRDVDGVDSGPLGDLYRPKYFNGGIAVHGYSSVPPYPASHGCVRVSNAAMDWLWDEGSLDYNSPVHVY
ncbi:L,D-transpeptidase-like protein [Haloactinospora alba]|uniref:L,D-transpeptidase-like protein n=1 Tax=Haloactinospora alba TaxID=405555 RepID=A0A543N9M9_9ACTN|nr:L,D-transpeptidase-like protein [Haloactinospora alba]